MSIEFVGTWINSTKFNNLDYNLVHDLAHSILRPAKLDADCYKITLIERATNFFGRLYDKPDYYIDAINPLSPQVYATRKKRNRIFLLALSLYLVKKTITTGRKL